MKNHIERCLPALFSDINDSKLNVKVVVVDNASDDGIENFLKLSYPEVKYIQLTENGGFGRAHNQALAVVDAKHYFILNPDTLFTPGSKVIAKFYNFMESNPKIGMAGPKLLNSDGSLQYSCWRWPSFLQPLFSRTKLGEFWRFKKVNDHYLMKDFSHEKTQAVDAIMGSAMFVRHEAVKTVGGFDDKYWMYFEDVDWSRRMWAAGWPVYYIHDIVITHSHGRGSAKVPGIIKALLKNKLARAHILSWFWYSWKWR